MSNQSGRQKLFLFTLSAFFISIFSAGNAFFIDSVYAADWSGTLTYTLPDRDNVQHVSVLGANGCSALEPFSGFPDYKVCLNTADPNNGEQLIVGDFSSWTTSGSRFKLSDSTHVVALYDSSSASVVGAGISVPPATSGVLLDSSLWTNFVSALSSNWSVILLILVSVYGVKLGLDVIKRILYMQDYNGRSAFKNYSQAEKDRDYSNYREYQDNEDRRERINTQYLKDKERYENYLSQGLTSEEADIRMDREDSHYDDSRYGKA